MPPPTDPRQLRLQSALRDTSAAIARAQQATATVALDPSSIGRLSRIDALQQQAMAQGLMARLQMEKRRLEAALDRFDAGTYGVCCACHDAIESARLLSDPAVVFCQACAATR